jgi:hypothetical protein
VNHQNHKNVQKIAEIMEDKGLKVWIDDRHNEDNMKISIARGIEQCATFIAFLTTNYNKKIGKGVDEKDWCFYEFNYATYITKPKNIILVIFEEGLAQRSEWATLIRAEFANRVYFDLSKYENSEAWPIFVQKIKDASAEKY